MTTTTEKLLQLAAEHEQKAQALRLAASELNGHQVTKKRETLPAQLQAAVALRESQRPQKAKKVSRVRRNKGALREAVLGFLQGGARSKAEVAAFLRTRFGVGHSQGLGSLYRYGHIKLTKQGIVVTARGATSAKGTKGAASKAQQRRRSSPEATWKRAHAALQAQGPMKWNQLREALGLKRTTNVSGAMYEHPEALQSDNGVWSAKA